MPNQPIKTFDPNAHLQFRSLPQQQQYALLSQYVGTSNANTLSYAAGQARADPYMANRVMEQMVSGDGPVEMIQDSIGGNTNAANATAIPPNAAQGSGVGASVGGNAMGNGYVGGGAMQDGAGAMPPNFPDAGSALAPPGVASAPQNGASDPGAGGNIDEIMMALGIGTGVGTGAYLADRYMQGRGSASAGSAGSAQTTPLEGELVPRGGPSGAMDANAVPLLPGGEASQYGAVQGDARIAGPNMQWNNQLPPGMPAQPPYRNQGNTLPTDAPYLTDPLNDVEREIMGAVDNQDAIVQGFAGQSPEVANSNTPYIWDDGQGGQAIVRPGGEVTPMNAESVVRAGHFVVIPESGEVFDIRTGTLADPQTMQQVIMYMQNGNIRDIIGMTPDDPYTPKVQPDAGGFGAMIGTGRALGRSAGAVF